MNVLLRIMVIFLAASSLPVRGDELVVNDSLSPAEQYRRLSLVLLIGEGVENVLFQRLQSDYLRALPEGPIDPDALKSPLLRIVDQDSMLAGTAYLFRVANEYPAAVGQRLRLLSEQYPEEIAGVSAAAIREDAILVRMAVADSIDYSGMTSDEALADALAVYQERTLELRDMLEFEQFDRELARITAEAIASVGSQLDAYQRMFDDEVQDDTFDHHIRSAERPYAGRAAVNEDAAKLAEEVMNGVVLSESRPDL
jgi:hypothetical protein